MILNLLRPYKIERTGDDSPARSLYGFVLRMSGWRQFVVIAIAAAVAGLAMVPLELQRIIIDDAVPAGDVQNLVRLGGVYLLVLVAQQSMKFVLRVYQGWIGESATRYAREHLSRLYRENERDLGAGSAAGIIRTEVDQLGAFVGEAFADPIVSFGTLIALFGYMVWVEPLVAGISVLFFLPQVIAVPWIQARINRLVDQRVGLLRRLSDRVQDAEFAQLSGRQWRHFTRRLDMIHLNRMPIYVLKSASKALVNGLNALAPLSALLVGGWMVIQGDTTIGVVVAFINGFDRMSDPLRDLISYYRMAALSAVRHHRVAGWIEETLALDAAEETPPEATPS